MTEHDKIFISNLGNTKNLHNRSFKESVHEIREQLMQNNEVIEAYSTWARNNEFNLEYLSSLISEQEKLEQYFNSEWNYKVTTPHNMLKFDKVYSSQAFIIVEHHAGCIFYHIYKRYFKFQDNGFCNITIEKVQRSQGEIIERINSMKTNYRNIYTIDEARAIKLKSREYEFEGTVIHDAIVGKEFGSGRFTDGIIETKFEILVPMN